MGAVVGLLVVVAMLGAALALLTALAVWLRRRRTGRSALISLNMLWNPGVQDEDVVPPPWPDTTSAPKDAPED